MPTGWLSRIDLSTSDKLYADQLNSLGLDIRNWGGDVNGGGHKLSNVILSGSGGFATSLSPVTVVPGSDSQSQILLSEATATPNVFANRWTVAKDATAETGANAGSNFAITRFDDNGNSLGVPLLINRASGIVTLGNALTVNGDVNITGSGQFKINGVPVVGGAVVSVFSRTGAVIAANDDYLFSQIKGMTAKGDLVVGVASPGRPAILSVGAATNGQVLTLDSTQTTGVKWSTPLMQPSGSTHAPGMAPDPGPTAGATKYLREDATWAVPAGGTGGTTNPAGSPGYVQFNSAGAFGGNVNFFWDNANSRLGINTSSPAYALGVVGDVNITGVYRIGTTPIPSSVFGRGGAVVAANGDYTFAQLGGMSAKGDLVVRDSSGPTIFAVGAATDGQVLTLDSTQTRGMKWAAPTGGGGSASQTPWTSNIDADAWYLYNCSAIMITDSTGTPTVELDISTGGNPAIYVRDPNSTFGLASITTADTFITGSIANDALHWSTAGRMAFATGGAIRMIVGTTGNVGIGIAPEVKLDVGAGSLLLRPVTQQNPTSTTKGLRMGFDPGGGGLGDILSYSWPSGPFQPLNIHGNPLMLVPDGSGNVGVGTVTGATLNYRFEVQAGRSVFSPASENYAIGIRNNKASSNTMWLGADASGNFIISNGGGTEYMRVSQTVPCLSINTTTISDHVTVNGLGGTGGYGQFRAVYGNYGFFLRNDGASVYFMKTASGDPYGAWATPYPMIVTLSNSYVGICTTSAPGYPLTVGGDLNITGVYRVNGTPLATGGGPTTQNVVTVSRSFGSIYLNNTGKVMYVAINTGLAGGASCIVYCDSTNNPSTTILVALGAASGSTPLMFIVLPNYYYKVLSGGTLNVWTEWS